jgi:hypothetical protein
MPRTHIADRQVHLYMTRRKGHAQEVAAAKAGMSVRTARRVAHATALPSQKPERDWRTRTNPFSDVWDGEIVPLLRSTPKLKAITLLQKLQRDHVDRFPDSMRRTLERHIRQWRALEGPSKEVFFPQTYEPRRAWPVRLHAHGPTGGDDCLRCVLTYALPLRGVNSGWTSTASR